MNMLILDEKVLSSGVNLFEIHITRFLALKIILQLSKFIIISQDSRTLS